MTVIDYEKIVDEKGRRVPHFGNYAGHAGMVDTLWALGRRLSPRGSQPGSRCSIRPRLRQPGRGQGDRAELGWTIRREGLPAGSPRRLRVRRLRPRLPRSPGDLQPPALRESRRPGSALFDKEIFRPETLQGRPSRGGHGPARRRPRFDLQEYYDHPEDYRPVTGKHTCPISPPWSTRSTGRRTSRFVTKTFLKTLYAGPSRRASASSGTSPATLRAASSAPSAHGPGEPGVRLRPGEEGQGRHSREGTGRPGRRKPARGDSARVVDLLQRG